MNFRNVRSVMNHEFRLMLADRRILASMAFLVGLTVFGAYSGRHVLQRQFASIEAMKLEEMQRRDRLRGGLVTTSTGDKPTPGAPAGTQTTPAMLGGELGSTSAVLPPGPLAGLSIGQSDMLPGFFRISTNSLQASMEEDEIANPRHLLTGRLDFGFVVIALYPLLILALSYDMLASEIENGTFSLVMSQPIRLSELIIGKLAVRFLAIITTAVLTSSLAVFLSHGVAAGDAPWVRWLLWLSVIVLYGAFWFALAALVNLRGLASATNALVLAGTWTALVLVIPNILNVLAATLYPIPSRVALIQATRSATIKANEEGSRSLAAYFEDHPELADPGGGNADDYIVRSLAIKAAIESQVQPLLDTCEQQADSQNRLVRRLRWLSPALAAQEAMETLAGSGRERHNEFVRQVKTFHGQWQSYFRPLIARKAPLGIDQFDAIPRFRFREEFLSTTVLMLIGPFTTIFVQGSLVALSAARLTSRFRTGD